MQLTHDQLHRLLALLGESDIQEFRLEGDDFRLEVRRGLPVAPLAIQDQAAVVSLTPGHPAAVGTSPAVAPAPPPAAVPTPSTPPPAAPAARADLQTITAPMVGTFYRASAPGEAPFVEVGGRIKRGQTVCILEAMKLMNELEAEVEGEVVEILVENGTPVEFGQALMRVKPA